MLFFCFYTKFLKPIPYIISIILIINTVQAQTASQYSATKAIKIASKVYKTERNLLLRLPEAYERTKAHYSVLYLLDAHDRPKFDFYCQTIDILVANQQIPPLIIVGIIPEANRRNYELTPKSNNPKHRNYGGADDLLLHFERELLPEIDGNYRTNGFKILSGHSFSGLFVAHSLVKKPNLFGAYIAQSPTLWYNDAQYVQQIDSLAQTKIKKFLFFSVSNGDETEQNIHISVEKLYETLKICKNKDFKWQFLELTNKTHATTPIFSFADAINFVFEAWRIPNDLAKAIKSVKNAKTDPLSAINNHKTRVEQLYNTDFDWSVEDYTYIMALPTLDKGNPLKAAAILKEAQDVYPAASFIDECLGDVAVVQENWAEAATHFEVALQKLLPTEAEFRAELLLKLKAVRSK
jgi:predicted alpha/beta superfamily hydrolase